MYMLFTWIFGIILVLAFCFLVLAFCVRMSSTIVLPVAFAGNAHLGIPKEKEYLNLDLDGFIDKNGKTLLLDKANCFCVCGQSMLLAGIEDNDILFTNPLSPDYKMDLPCVTVIKRDHFSQCDMVAQGNIPQYKVRRTWGQYDISKKDEHYMLRKLEGIIEMPEFIALTKESALKCSMNTDEMKKDFLERRWPAYKKNYPTCQQDNDKDSQVIISTTLDVKENKVHFSIHPRRCLVGVATNSFSVAMAA